jgi:RNA polymerase sigma factor (TIGR02999 family)
MSQITLILERLNRGEGEAYHELVPLVYAELRRRAAQRLWAGRAEGRGHGHTLQATALVHEVFLRLLPGTPEGPPRDGGALAAWQGSRHFYNAAAEVMKQIVLNHAREQAALKRGGALRRVDLAGVEPPVPATPDDPGDWEALDQGLAELKAIDQRRYQVVMLRYFAGLTDAQVAQAVGMSEKTVERDWAAARAFLRAAVLDSTA